MSAETGYRRRAPGWRSALHRVIEARRRTAFAYGSQDCGLFAADCVRASTGVDLAAAYRGQYVSLAEGQALLAADGYADHIALAAAHLPELADPQNEMQSGDLAVIDNPGGDPSLGVVSGEAIQVVTTDGIGMVPVTRAVRAFRVG